MYKNKTNKNSIIKQIKIENNNIINNQRDIAHEINTYYCQLGKKLSEKYKHQPIQTYKTIFINPTNENEVLKITQLKNKKGSIDNISTKVLKTISPLIAETIAHIINLSIETSTWPNELKSYSNT